MRFQVSGVRCQVSGEIRQADGKEAHDEENNKA
jgi:hypothetical protein